MMFVVEHNELIMKLTKSLRNRIDILRKERKLSWEKLAYSAGIAKTTFSYLNKAENDIKLSTVCKIAMALGITPSQLLDFDIDLSELD